MEAAVNSHESREDRQCSCIDGEGWLNLFGVTGDGPININICIRVLWMFMHYVYFLSCGLR